MADRILSVGCSTKKPAHYSFHGAVYNSYFEKFALAFHFCWPFADRRLSLRGFTKGTGHYSFHRTAWNSYFEKVLFINFISTYSNLLTIASLLFCSSSVRKLLWTGCSSKDSNFYSFDRAILNIYFENVLLINFINNLLKHLFFCRLISDRKLWTACSKKGGDHCSFSAAVSNYYFEETILNNFVSS